MWVCRSYLSALLFLGMISFPMVMEAGVLQVTDQSLQLLASQSNPVQKQIDAKVETAKAQSAFKNSEYDPKLAASYDYTSSKEQAIIQFIPVFRPERHLQVGLEQKLSYGMKINTGVFANQVTAESLNIVRATQVGAQVGLELDIWKNFLGRLDRKTLEQEQLTEDVAKIQGSIDRTSFLLDVRKAYWGMIATELSLNLSKRLIKTAKKQLAVTKKRVREGAADTADVSRNQAQVQARESAVLFFSYQKQQLMSYLQSLLPGLEGTEVMVSMDERASMEAQTRQCLAQIASEPTMNPQFTDYPKIVEMLEKQRKNAVDIAQSMDSMDLKLNARYQASGVNQGHSKAFDELTDQFRNGYSVGVALKIPLGSGARKARESQVLATGHQISAQREALRLKLVAEHSKAQKALALLGQASTAQEGMVKSLKTSLVQAERKYRQARISLNTLILEQDNYFNAELQHIETQKQILDFLFDYFKVFPKHSCPANIFSRGNA